MGDNDGNSFNFTIDGTCALKLAATDSRTHQLGIVVDAGPKIAFFVVDGVLCDGGIAAVRGWSWVSDSIGDLSTDVDALQISETYEGKVLGGRMYSRALKVSELVGNYRAGPPQSDN